ncbi:hypothetical protein WR25_03736 [Diploscapter pachys]|uniref:Plasminogen receptor (KT) n=1 Tax=Diploscapter pachys TaxID=2018661 RepID=A0A2A2LNZ0_9BILA|nr:hypothetical protein WR25_03736 [Diploscapter pachys]
MGQRASSLQTDTVELKKILDEQMEDEIALQESNILWKQAYERYEKRERFGWLILGGATTLTTMMMCAIHYKRKECIIPIIPIVMVIGYEYDGLYGERFAKIRENAYFFLDDKKSEIKFAPIDLKQIDAYRSSRHF